MCVVAGNQTKLVFKQTIFTIGLPTSNKYLTCPGGATTFSLIWFLLHLPPAQNPTCLPLTPHL